MAMSRATRTREAVVLLVSALILGGCWNSTGSDGTPDGGDTDADIDTDSDVDTDADTDTDTDTDTDSDTDSDTDFDTDTQCAGEGDFTSCTLVTIPDRDYDICVDGACVSPGCGDVNCNTPGPHFPLPDTNQRACYDADTEGETVCPDAGAMFYGQDAQYGWDTAHAATERFTRDLTSAGSPIVVDNVTGLTWLSCALGYSGDDCTEEGETVMYTWEEALAACDALSWGDYDDWRLPDAYELASIFDSGQCRPTMDTVMFPLPLLDWTDFPFWSSTTALEDYAPSAWTTWVMYGILMEGEKAGTTFVRCVRGAPTPHPVRFTRDTSLPDAPVVEDSFTGLEWQGCARGMSGDACELGEAVTGDWASALAYCEGLSWGGHDDWRLPNRNEGMSIVDIRHYAPQIDTDAFPASPSGVFWTSTSIAGVTSIAVGADVGLYALGYFVTIVDKSESTEYTRCVR